ncbi:MAG: hypothetical protein E7028_02790 [Planctomycetaceae bacterium]|nr:hypothetical protein [Planctomycetaceae bacterium]MBQ2820874.1 hypothetical protein [Thermoguttaceae bacterium]MDO4424358.1 hypothetical protein [Planctomycetia bacterium]
MYEENPFCTRRIKPGAIPFYFPEGISLQTLIGTLRENAWCGQIIGPHGSGKSTLLAALLPEIAESGRRIVHLELQDGVRQLPLSDADFLEMNENTQLAIDGYEQLSYWTRRRIKSKSAKQGFGVIILGHEPLEYPDLYQTSRELAVAKLIVSRLLENTIVRIPESVIEEHFELYSGNLREMLFSLYDVYEEAYRTLKGRR